MWANFTDVYLIKISLEKNSSVKSSKIKLNVGKFWCYSDMIRLNMTEKILKRSHIDIFRKNKYYNSRGWGKY